MPTIRSLRMKDPLPPFWRQPQARSARSTYTARLMACPGPSAASIPTGSMATETRRQRRCLWLASTRSSCPNSRTANSLRQSRPLSTSRTTKQSITALFICVTICSSPGHSFGKSSNILGDSMDQWFPDAVAKGLFIILFFAWADSEVANRFASRRSRHVSRD